MSALASSFYRSSARTASRSFLLSNAALFLLAMSGDCAAPTSPISRGVSAITPDSPLLSLQGLDIQDQGRLRTLGDKESLRDGQNFSIRLALTQEMYIYVVLEHTDERRAVLHPQPGAPPSPMGSGRARLPQPGDWFSIPKTEPGDRLCVIGSELPTNQLWCIDKQQKRDRDRGEDQPPPAPQKRAGTPPPPPPPDDKDDGRGGRRIIRLPLVTP